MRLTHLSLENYRGFKKLVLDFDPRLTVLVGSNGSGKSSVLDAVAMTVRDLLGRLDPLTSGNPLDAKDEISIGAEWMRTALSVTNGTGVATYSASVHRDGKPAGHRLYDATQDWLFSADFVAIYETSVRAFQEWATPSFQVAPDDIGLEGSLSPGPNSLRRFSDWFRQAEDLENESRVRKADLGLRLPVLEGLREGLKLLLGADQIEFRRDLNELVIRRRGSDLNLHQLSDGERGMLLLVGDIARRLALRVGSANPAQLRVAGGTSLVEAMSNPLLTEAVVLIDELDSHLHPAWQRTVIHRLLKIFPNCQFIVATHSPQVLSTVPREASIVLLGDFQPQVLPPAEGRDSNSILNAVFGLPERPEDMVKELRDVARLIDDDKYEEAKARIAAMEKVLTSQDPDVVHYRSLIDFMERGRAADQEGH